MNRLWVIPSPALKNQIARDLSHREAHRTFREDFQSKSREPGLTRRRARSRLALEAISGFSKTRNLLYPRPPSGENIPKVVAQIAPGSEKRPLSDRVLAGSNLGCQRLLKKRFFLLTHNRPVAAGWIRTLRGGRGLRADHRCVGVGVKKTVVRRD